MSGTKFDQGKPDLTMVSRTFVEQVAKVMMFGATKYGRDNYLEGMSVLRLLAAAQRHIKAFEDGEDTDPESNLNHLAHAAANLNMIMNLERHSKLKDNRYCVKTNCIDEKSGRVTVVEIKQQGNSK